MISFDFKQKSSCFFWQDNETMVQNNASGKFQYKNCCRGHQSQEELISQKVQFMETIVPQLIQHLNGLCHCTITDTCN